jgi:hypothetical protein
MSDIAKADTLATIHLAFVAFVVVGQVLIMLLGGFGVRWVRNFTFRTVHLLCIGVVAGEALAGIECPLTTWERDLRRANRIAYDQAIQRPNVEDPDYDGDFIRDVTGSCLVGRVSNRILFYQVRPEQLKYFAWGHITLGVIVFATFFLVPPRWPWRKQKPTPAPASAAPPAPAGNEVRPETEAAGQTGIKVPPGVTVRP